MKRRWGSYAVGVALAGFVAASVPSVAIAKDASNCVSSEEVAAFRLRDLQSRFMVAALSCNQQTAYNAFIERFRPSLTLASAQIQAYFKRNGGEPALNRHMTQLANASGLARAEEPEQYCGDTWAMFLLLDEAPDGLPVMAAKYTPGVAMPSQCGSEENPVIVPSGPTAPVLKASTEK